MMNTRLYLIPVPLAEDASATVAPYRCEDLVTLKTFFVEDEKQARKHLKLLIPQVDLRSLHFYVLNEHTHLDEFKKFIDVLKNESCGLLSDAGLPCIADPGSHLVRLAHEHNIEVMPLVGPSSILLALISSGLNGQNFSFVGYLPKEKETRLKKILELEQASLKNKQTQVFIETPYHNETLFKELLETLSEKCHLSLSCDLTSATQKIKTKTIAQWKKQHDVAFNKHPCVFLFGYN